MSLAVGFIVAFAIIALGGVGLAGFAIAHRQRSDGQESNAEQCR